MVQYSFRLHPLLRVVCAPPQVKLSGDSIYKLLLLAGLCEVRSTLIVEEDNNLLQAIHCVLLHVMAHSLWRIEGGGI